MGWGLCEVLYLLRGATEGYLHYIDDCMMVEPVIFYLPRLLLLRFLPNKDFATVAEMLKQVFLSITLERKITVLRETLHIRSGDGSRSSGSLSTAVFVKCFCQLQHQQKLVFKNGCL